VSTMAKGSLEPDFNEAITKALRESVEATPPLNRGAASVVISGISYSTMDLLLAIDQRTAVGVEILKALDQLQKRMRVKNPNASVVDLIRRSVVREASAAGD
jgi:hypothetical protein